MRMAVVFRALPDGFAFRRTIFCILSDGRIGSRSQHRLNTERYYERFQLRFWDVIDFCAPVGGWFSS